jgi:hypothetical protein
MLAAAEVDCTGKPPEYLIATVEIDPMYGVAPCSERLPETFEKSRRHALQKEKGAIGWRRHYHRLMVGRTMRVESVRTRRNTIPRTESSRVPGER